MLWLALSDKEFSDLIEKIEVPADGMADDEWVLDGVREAELNKIRNRLPNR